jgi:hypothetical protein
VLSKVSRWSDGDEDHALRLHRAQPLELETLVVRYVTEMTNAVGDLRRLRSHLLMCVESLFGLAARRQAAARLAEP